MELWWSSLGTSLQVFYGIALASSLLLVLQLVALLFGIDDGDGGFGDGHDSGLGVLSLRTVTAFFTGFGWGGVVAIKAGFGLLASIAVGLGLGGLLMAAVVALMRGFAALRHSGTLDYRNAIGRVANVYVAVPAAMGGAGKIEVLIQGRLSIVEAFTRSAERLPVRSRVRVAELLDAQTLIVEPLSTTEVVGADAASPHTSAGSPPSPAPGAGSHQEG